MDNPQLTPVSNQQSETLNQKPQSSFLTILLSTLLIIACVIAGFFAWQTQNLVKELQMISNESKQTPLPTSTSDSMTNWKTYSNSELSFSFKITPLLTYPEIIVPSLSNSFSNKEGVSSPLELAENDILLESTVYTDIDEASLKKVRVALITNIGDIVSQPFQPIGNIKKIASLDNGGSIFEESPASPNEATYYIAIWENNTNIHVLKMFAMENVLLQNKILFEQMAKSYIFTNSPNQIACTMDAKICPDGSAVGRSGPKCEFAPCPTTSPLQ